MTTVLGIDEAGRGPVIGPMVIGAAVIEKKREKELTSLGVKDSKLLTKIQREEIYEKLKKVLDDYMILKVSAKEIDEILETSNLNKAEAEKFGYLVKTLNPDIAIIDTPQVSTDKFCDLVKSHSQNQSQLICENKADLNHPIVAAASILAKVERDREIEKIQEEYGDIGIGYPSDEKTIKFVEDLAEKGEYPDFVRKNWATAKEIRIRKTQKKLGDF